MKCLRPLGRWDRGLESHSKAWSSTTCYRKSFFFLISGQLLNYLNVLFQIYFSRHRIFGCLYSELEGMWKEGAVNTCKEYSQYLPGKLRKIFSNT
jgi:hypothetical protein